MSFLKGLAEQMIASQGFYYKSFYDAVATIEYQYRKKTLFVTYDKLSLSIYDHNLTAKQHFILGKNLSNWLLTHNSEDQKLRIEYSILFQYASLFPEYQHAEITKSLHPDFVVRFDDITIGVEVTRLEKSSDNIMTKIISEQNKPGMTANEILAKAFSKHGEKVREYEIFEIGDDVFAIQHVESLLITNDAFAQQIVNKLDKYEALARSFTKFILLCNAQKGITITSEFDARLLLNKVSEKRPDSKITIAILFLNSSNVLCCAHSN